MPRACECVCVYVYVCVCVLLASQPSRSSAWVCLGRGRGCGIGHDASSLTPPRALLHGCRLASLCADESHLIDWQFFRVSIWS